MTTPAAMNHNAEAFPGLTKLEYFLIHSAWEPDQADISMEIMRDHNRNPFNENDKPARRSRSEIVADLKIKHAREILDRIGI